MRRDFETDVAIPFVSLDVDRSQHTGSSLDIANRQQLVKLLCLHFSLLLERLERHIVVRAPGAGFFEDTDCP